MNITLRKCILREWRWEDKDSLIRHANNLNIAKMVKNRFPYPYDEAAAKAGWPGHKGVPQTILP